MQSPGEAIPQLTVEMTRYRIVRSALFWTTFPSSRPPVSISVDTLLVLVQMVGVGRP